MINSLFKISSIATLLAIVFTTSGCSELTATVDGKVYYDGNLIKVKDNQRGKVIFRAVDGGATCMGLIDSEGSYSISTGTTNALVPGDYLVAVSVVEIIQDEDKDLAPKAKSITPSVYSDTLTSGLTFLAKRGANTYDIRLKVVAEPVIEEPKTDGPSMTDDTIDSDTEPSDTENSTDENSTDKEELSDSTSSSGENQRSVDEDTTTDITEDSAAPEMVVEENTISDSVQSEVKQ